MFENVQQNAAGSFVTGNEGWEHPKDRPSFTPFTLNWDEWDRELLRNSRSRIKSMFRPLYYAAQDRPGNKRGPSPGLIKLRNLKARLFPAQVQVFYLGGNVEDLNRIHIMQTEKCVMDQIY